MSVLAARDPAERVELLIRLTERLTGLLERETELFDARSPHQAAALREEKGELANLYRHEVGRIGKDPSLVAGAPAARRGLLASATERFHAALAENQRAGEALRALSEGIVRSVAEEAARMRGAGQGYGPGPRPGGSAPAHAVALNQTV